MVRGSMATASLPLIASQHGVNWLCAEGTSMWSGLVLQPIFLTRTHSISSEGGSHMTLLVHPSLHLLKVPAAHGITL